MEAIFKSLKTQQLFATFGKRDEDIGLLPALTCVTNDVSCLQFLEHKVDIPLDTYSTHPKFAIRRSDLSEVMKRILKKEEPWERHKLFLWAYKHGSSKLSTLPLSVCKEITKYF